MSAFTTITDGLSIPYPSAYFAELMLAWEERCDAAGLSFTASGGADGDPLNDVSDSASWGHLIKDMQTWIETFCDRFVDHTQAVSGNFDGQATIPAFTWSTFKTAAGLNASGWSRLTSASAGPAPNAYGGLANGDALMAFLITELQAAFSTLLWTRVRSSSTTRGWLYKTSYNADCATARAAIISGWTTSWAAYTGPVPPFWQAGVHLDDTLGLPAAAYRIRGKGNATLPTTNACSIDVHYFMTTYGSFPFGSMDAETAGIVEDTFFFFETLGSAQTASRDSNYIGDITTNPMTDAPVTCPYAEDNGLYAQCVGSIAWILKWEFTNS